MKTSKHIDLVCVIALIVALVIAASMYRVTKTTDSTTTVVDSEQFTSYDLNADWDTSSATMITLDGTTGTVTGNGAYIYEGDLYIVYSGYYVISGELSDGSIIINADGSDDIWIQFDGVSLTCSDNAAFIVENADNVYLTLAENSENSITDSSSYSETAEDEGVNAALFSHDDLTINGSGSLTITGNYKHGLVAKDDLAITGGNITIVAIEDGIHANDSVRIAEANITIDAGDDGITVSNDDATDYFYIESGTVTVNTCYEGIEANDIYINGGDIYIYPTDDGLNATGTEGDGIVINDGSITVINENGQDADGLDSNSSITINGGYVYVSVPTDGTALDYGSESQGTLSINGGTVIAAGSSMMLESISEESQQGFLMATDVSGSAGSTVIVSDSSGNEVLEATVDGQFTALILSSNKITSGKEYTITIDGTQTTVTANENNGVSSMGMMDGTQDNQMTMDENASQEMPEMDGQLPDDITNLDENQMMTPTTDEMNVNEDAQEEQTSNINIWTFVLVAVSIGVILFGIYYARKFKGKI